MKLYTDELQISALDAESMKLLTDDIPSLEKELGISYKAEPITGMFKKVVLGQLEKIAANEADYLWNTLWLIVRSSDAVAVGSADFKGAPDAAGRVEIGYGLAKEFEHNGYMTKCVSAMCDWALANGASAVLAYTEPGNLASQAVLERCGFKFSSMKDGMPLYIKER